MKFYNRFVKILRVGQKKILGGSRLKIFSDGGFKAKHPPPPTTPPGIMYVTYVYM
jgi:hypothetical protein